MPSRDIAKRRAAEARYRAKPEVSARKAEAARLWREAHPSQYAARIEAWKAANPDRRRRTLKDWRAENPEAVRLQGLRRRDRIRKAIFDHYGRECRGCGFSDERALTLDHVHNDGAAERRSMRTVSTFYERVIKAGFPDRYQTLCANCQLIKAKAVRRRLVAVTA